MSAKWDPEAAARRILRWSEITELCLLIRGSILLGPGHSDAECLRAGLAEARRKREAREGG